MTKQRLSKIKRTLRARQLDTMVIVDEVHKPYNLAAIMRTCDAVGVPQIHAVYPKPTIRTSVNAAAGTKRWVNVTTEPSIDKALAKARAQSMLVLGAHPCPLAIDFREIDYTQPVAIVMGGELNGFSDYTLSQLDHTIKIPMHGMGESLNVSVAAALILFELERQRNQRGLYDIKHYSPEQLQKLTFEWAQPKFSRFCADQKMPYPALDDEGDIIHS